MQQHTQALGQPLALQDILSFLTIGTETPPAVETSKSAHEMLHLMRRAYYPKILAEQAVDWIRSYTKHPYLPELANPNGLLFILEIAPHLGIKRLANFYTRVLVEYPRLSVQSASAQHLFRIRDFDRSTRVAAWQALKKRLQEWEGKPSESIFSSAARLGFPSALIVGERHAQFWLSERIRRADMLTAANAVHAVIHWVRFLRTEPPEEMATFFYQDFIYRLLRDLEKTDPLLPADIHTILCVRLFIATGLTVPKSSVSFLASVLAHYFGMLSDPENSACLRASRTVLNRFHLQADALFPKNLFKAREYHQVFHKQLRSKL